MMHTRLFRHTFRLLFFVGFINLCAIYFYFYWTIWWFDMFVHFSAGACVAMAAILLLFYYKHKSLPTIPQTILTAIWSAFLIGIAWEFYEWFFEITSLSDGAAFWLDTVSDIIMDVSGGVVGSIYAHHILFKDNK